MASIEKKVTDSYEKMDFDQEKNDEFIMKSIEVMMDVVCISIKNHISHIGQNGLIEKYITLLEQYATLTESYKVMQKRTALL